MTNLNIDKKLWYEAFMWTQWKQKGTQRQKKPQAYTANKVVQFLWKQSNRVHIAYTISKINWLILLFSNMKLAQILVFM